MKNRPLKLLKNFAVFLIITGIVFSNIPFYALTELIDTYEKTSGIVDKIWLVQQENNADVVDKFVSLRHAAENLKVREVQAAPIAQYSGGLLVYADTATVGTPKYKTFDDTDGFGAEQNASSVGASAINWIGVAASPTNDEWIIVTRDAANVIKAQVCTGVDGGVSCGTPTTITSTAGTHGFRNFAVAYEQTSGDALLVYGTATVDELRKIEWTGGVWTNDAAITTTRTSGTVEWVELTSRPGSDQIGIAYSDSNDDISAYRWSGTAMGDEATAVITASGVTGDVRKFDVSFEGVSGDMLVAAPLSGAGTVATGQLVGTTWTIGTQTAPDNITAFIDLQEPNPSDNDIAMIAHGTAASSNPAEGYEWSGTGLVDGTVAVDTAITNWAANYHMAGIAYVSSTYYAAAVFSDATGADDINWWTMNSAGTWTAQADNLRTRGTTQFINLFDYPAADKVLLFSSDANSDLWADEWNGSTPSATVWVDRTSGGALETNLSLATKKVFDFAFRLAPTPAVVTAASAGTQTSLLNSSDVNQYLGAAFSFQQSSGSADTITAITISDVGGTVNANTTLSDARLRYETGQASCSGTYAGTETIAKEGVAFNASDQAVFTSLTSNIPLTLSPNFTCVYLEIDLVNAGAYPSGGQTFDPEISGSADFTLSGGSNKAGTYPVAPTGATTVRPKVTGYTNSTESGLNWSAACTGCGARIGTGGFVQTVVISGFGFGTDPGAGSRDTATNKVEVVGAATNIMDDPSSAPRNVNLWSNTSITITTDTAVAGDADTDWGANFGDSAALRVTAGGQVSTPDLEFFVFPQVTSLTVPTAIADAAREYNAADTDGVVTLNGTRFGTAPTGGYVRILGCDSSTCSSPTGSVTVVSDATCDAADGWANTCVKVQVPAVIANSTYTGSIVIQQGTGSGNKTHTYATTFRILPRITSNNPASGSVNDKIQINGDHLCQSGTCPTTARSSAANNVKFDATQAADAADGDDFVNAGGSPCGSLSTAWNHAEICLVVPAGVSAGSRPTQVTSNTSYTSNTQAFTVQSTVPDDPTSLNQYLDGGITAVAVGGSATSTVVFKASKSAGVTGQTLCLQIEADTVTTPFDGIVTAEETGGTCEVYNGTPVTGEVKVTGLTNASSYHWRARVKNSGTSETSNWAAFGANPSGDGSGDGNPANTDFSVDSTAPVFGTGTPCALDPADSTPSCTPSPSSSPTDIQAKIYWTTDDGADEWVAYGTSCPTGQSTASTTFDALPNKKPVSASGSGTTHSQTISSLNAATTYHYIVRARNTLDLISFNPSSANTCKTFTTASAVTRILKTTEFFIQQATSTSLLNAFPKTFDVFVPESDTGRTNATFKSIIVEIGGVIVGDGSGDITVGVDWNSGGAVNYTLSDPGSGKAASWRIMHPVSSINYDCPDCTDVDNTLDVTVTGATASTATRAKVIMTYSYTP